MVHANEQHLARRGFMGQCAGLAACQPGTASALRTLSTIVAAATAQESFASEAKPRLHGRAVLVDAQGRNLRGRDLKPQLNYVFHYPYEGTPVFLLNLGKVAAGQTLKTKDGGSYTWPGGVGPGRSLVAFSAICAHQLVYPTAQLSFISYRKDKPAKGIQAGLIHCCAEHSQYDPAAGARVLAGPAEQPLCAVLLEHDRQTDALTAYGTLGGELFDAFFAKYDAKLALDVGSRAKAKVEGTARVLELDKFCKNNVQC
jgi:arsenite oxidase small subunit